MTSRQRVALTDVFTPTRPARLTFVERDELNDKLVAAIRTPGKQLVVYGHSGSGKTTLLVNKLHQLYGNHITTRCIGDLTLEHVILDAFDQLAPYYAAEETHGSSRSLSTSLRAEYSGLQAQVQATLASQQTVSVKRVLPPQLTPQTLARLLGSAGLCWVLEDFHKLPVREKHKLSQVMKVFMDTADEYPQVKIIAIGAVDTAREVVEYDPEMRNRVAEIHVPLMSPTEIEQILLKGENLLNFSLDAAVHKGIVGYSNGLASVAHHLSLNICHSVNLEETADQLVQLGQPELEAAVEQYLDEASDTIKAAFDKAFRRQRARKYDNCKLIIQALTDCSQEGATHSEILAKIRAVYPEYPSGNLTTYLRELQSVDRGALLRLDSASGRYSFADPLFRAFAVAKLRARSDAISVFAWSSEDTHKTFQVVMKQLTESLERLKGGLT